MRYILALALLLLCSYNSSNAQIKFTDYNDAAKAEAKANNQLIFIEFTAGWCPPCKMMKRDVFSDKTVGDFYMNNFVCTQVDVDKQSALASKYDAGSIPNFVFVNANGDVVHRGLGYQAAETFISLGKAALNKAGKSTSTQPTNSSLPQPGNVERPKTSATALNDCLESGGDCESEVKSFINGATWDDSEKNMSLLVSAVVEGSETALMHYKKHKEKFAKQIGLSELESQIITAVMTRILAEVELEGDGIDWAYIDQSYEEYLPKTSVYRYQQITRALIYTELGKSEEALKACDNILSKKGLAGLNKESKSEIYQSILELSSSAVEASGATADGEIPQDYLQLLYTWLKDWEEINPSDDVYGILAIVCTELGKDEEAEKYSSYID